MAAYYTKASVTHLLAGLAVRKTAQRVLDPACGDGRLLVAAIQQKQAIWGSGFQEVKGLDIDTNAIEQARRSLGRLLEDVSTQIQCIDAFEWAQKNDAASFDLILMNPPFTRKQVLASLEPDRRHFLWKEFKDEILPNPSKSAYYEFFLRLADILLRNGGIIAVILPVSFLRGRNPRFLRQFYLSSYTIEYMILRLDEPSFSEDTALREVLLVAKKTPPSKEVQSKLVFLKKLTPHTISQLFKLHNSPSPIHNEFPNLCYRLCPQINLDSLNLHRAVAFTEPLLYDMWSEIVKSKYLSLIRETNVNIRSKNEPARGGTFTGLTIVSPEYITSRDEWVFDSVDASHVHFYRSTSKELYSLTRDLIWPAFRRIPHHDRLDVSDLDEYVIYRYPEDSPILSQLKQPVNWRIWQKYLSQRRSHLLLVERVDITAPGSRLMAYFSDPSRVWSRVSASLKGMSAREAKCACLWFNSSFFMLGYLLERDETRGGYVQLHKYIIRELPILLPRVLLRENVAVLERLFNELQTSSFPSFLEQLAALVEIPDEELLQLLDKESHLMSVVGQGFPPRQRIDTQIQRILEITSINFNELYPALLKELLFLKQMMRVHTPRKSSKTVISNQLR